MSTAASIPRLISTALEPSFRRVIPFLTNSRAKSVDVVVPSPALSAVLMAAYFAILTPKFSTGSSNSSICLATVTPSLVEYTLL